MKPTEPRRILVATDFSLCSQPATDYAVILARRFKATLSLLFVAEPPTFVAPDAICIVDRAIEAEVLEGHKRMDAALVALAQADLAALSGEVVVGLAADVAVGLANSGRYDLVILGTHGRGGFKHLLLGSVAEQVVRRSLIPVLTIHSGAR